MSYGLRRRHAKGNAEFERANTRMIPFASLHARIFPFIFQFESLPPRLNEILSNIIYLLEHFFSRMTKFLMNTVRMSLTTWCTYIKPLECSVKRFFKS